MEALLLERTSYDWAFILIVICLAAIAWVRVSFPKRIQEFATAFVSNRYINQITREENPFTNLSMLVLYLSFLVNISIFLYLLNSNFGFNQFLERGLSSFLIILVLIFTFDVVKLFFYWYTASIFRTESQTTAHVLNLMLNRAGVGLILLVFNLLIAYSALPAELLAYTSIGIIALLFIYRIIKSLPVNQNKGSYPVHYFILYICTLEISPILILGKYFSSV